MCHEFTFRSADGKTDLHAAEWIPQSGEVRAVLQVSHGVAEYILRYGAFARYLTERGIAVVGHDHLGHGDSLTAGGTRLYFGPKGSWAYLADDLNTRCNMAKKRFPGVPYFLLGHSMGSFAARSFLIRYPGQVDGCILMGTAYQSLLTLKAGHRLACLEAGRKGEREPSPMLEHLVFGNCVKAFPNGRTELDWLSANQANVDRYWADPLCGGTPTAGLFRELLWGMAFNEERSNLSRMDMDTPVLFVSGQEDPVGGMGRDVERARDSFLRAGVRDVELKLWPGLRHELLNEEPWQAVADQLLDWLERHL